MEVELCATDRQTMGPPCIQSSDDQVERADAGEQLFISAGKLKAVVAKVAAAAVPAGRSVDAANPSSSLVEAFAYAVAKPRAPALMIEKNNRASGWKSLAESGSIWAGLRSYGR
jgi:hypothetical protein